ncbi:PREDICTED: polynucleotide 5'-hydroxyl-kinase NOL9-like [Acropora digitifera]|uniref:polynucleotide 5'-hydroxyl-kinase NOL9-like n=1 Tax=Acropora digitifera TaxID=70779 RepID=UPI00077A7CAC|nr:PREDICTED: polynucleotide 5'-hydroxyl-kinase NOL9-like [Acropora digitifera]
MSSQMPGGIKRKFRSLNSVESHVRRSKRLEMTSLAMFIDRFERRRAAFNRALEKTNSRKRKRKIRPENKGVSKGLNRVNDPASNSAAGKKIDLKGRKSTLNSELRYRKGRKLRVTQTIMKRVTGKRRRTAKNEHSKNKRVHTESSTKKKSQNAPRTRLRKKARKEVYGSDGCKAMNEEKCSVRAENESREEQLTLESVFRLSNDLANSCLLFLTKGQKVCIKGVAQIEVLCGSADIFGSILKPGHVPVDIFSGSTSSLITFSQCSQDDFSTAKDCSGKIQHALRNQPPEIMKMIIARGMKMASVLLLKSLQTVEVNFVSSFKKYGDIFKLELGKVDTPVVLICGGKDVGKSTFARYLTNSFLNSRKELFFLECDVGQTEFTPPGLISLNKVSSPLLGPPFTHIQQPERSVFFGDVTPRDKPDFYIQCVRYVFETYAENYRKSKIPLIVNTLGWVKGISVKPRTNTPNSNTNAVPPNPDNTDYRSQVLPLHREEGEQEQEGKTGAVFNPVILQLDANKEKDKVPVSKYTAADKRALALLSYLSRTNPDLRSGGPGSRRITSLLSCVPYSVPWNQLAIHIMHTELPWDQILYSINASVVGLAEVSVDQMHRREENNLAPYYFVDNPVVECHGLGIVRNVDPTRQVLYVLTPLSLEVLQRVNTLLKGNLEIPAALLLSVSTGRS